MKPLKHKVEAVGLAMLLASMGYSVHAAATLALLDVEDMKEEYRQNIYENKVDPDQMTNEEALHELLLTALTDMPEFCLVDKTMSPEAEAAGEQWNYRANPKGEKDNLNAAAAAMDMDRFANIFLSVEETPVYMTQEGDTISQESLEKLRVMYDAQYYLYPVITAVTNHDKRTKGLVLSTSKSDVVTRVLCRLISGSTGQVVWAREFSGKGKNVSIGLSFGKGAGAGTISQGDAKFHQGLVTGSIEKVSQHIIDGLKEAAAKLAAPPASAGK